jgi:four helix bundle protein
LGSQLRKAAYSVPANIAEGYGYGHRRDRLHFLNIAEASLAEAASAFMRPGASATSTIRY